MPIEELVDLQQRRRRRQLDRDVARQHRQAGHGVLTLEANGDEWVGGQLRSREGLVIGLDEITQRPLVATTQGQVLGRDAEGEERERELVDEVDRRALGRHGRQVSWTPTDQRVRSRANSIYFEYNEGRRWDSVGATWARSCSC